MRTLEAKVYLVLVDSLEASKHMSNGTESGESLPHTGMIRRHPER